MPITQKLLKAIESNEYKDELLFLHGGDNDSLGDADMPALVSALNKNTHIKCLTLDSNNIGDKGAEELSKLAHVKQLSLEDNPIGDAGASCLFKSRMISLELGGDRIGDAAFKGLEENTTLECLILNRVSISAQSIKVIASFKVLKKLVLNQLKVGKEGAEYLAKSSLEYIALEYASVGDEGCALFGDSKTLKELWITDDSIGEEGVRGLSRSKTITDLNLSRNKLGDGCVGPLSSMKLRSLSIPNNKIGEVACARLKEALQGCFVDVTGNFIPKGEGFPALLEAYNRSKNQPCEEEPRKENKVRPQ